MTDKAFKERAKRFDEFWYSSEWQAILPQLEDDLRKMSERPSLDGVVHAGRPYIDTMIVSPQNAKKLNKLLTSK